MFVLISQSNQIIFTRKIVNHFFRRFVDCCHIFVKIVQLPMSYFSILEPATTLKKLKIHIETLHSTKLKEEKASKAKGGKKKGGTVKMDLSKDILGGSGAGGYDDDFDDFM